MSFTACSGNYAKMDLKEPIALNEDGIVEKKVFEKIKKENAIAIFTGESGGLKYEWTIFGSDIKDTRDVNMSVALKNTNKGIRIQFSEKEDFGFPALLSISLNEQWTADSATAYDGNDAVYSVSITRSKTSILNISVNKIVAECEVIPDTTEQPESVLTTENDVPDDSNKDDDKTHEQDDYISDDKDAESEIIPDTGQSESTPSTENNASDDTNTDNSEMNEQDDYLSDVKDSDNRLYSDGQSEGKDKYETDPVPEGKPLPVEPEDTEVDTKKSFTCTISIECSTILNNLEDLDPDKLELVPSDGVILAPTRVTFYEGESVFDVLQRVCQEKGIHLESSWTPVYNSAYIEGIHNLYEFDCGELSGWMYRVNGWYPNYGCSRYQLVDGEVIEWRYTCDLGNDVGRDGTW